jgi:DNA mismatch repair protein MutS
MPFTCSTDIHIVNGRHPAVEHGQLINGLPYTANSIHLSHGPGGAFVHLITGPNMCVHQDPPAHSHLFTYSRLFKRGGKSTHIRTVALIALLAQVGAYVPADDVELGVCDRIFTRLATSDNIHEDQSAYMVEMLETSEIVRLGTKRSLVSPGNPIRFSLWDVTLTLGAMAGHH